MSYFIKNKVLSGEQFNELFRLHKLFKVIPEREHKYIEGINRAHKFNPDKYDIGGLEFCDEILLYDKICVGALISEVIIPNDSKVFVYDSGFHRGYKADKIILKNIIDIADLPNWSSNLFCELMLDNNPALIQHIREPLKEYIYFAIKKDGVLIKYINNPSHDICILALEHGWHVLEYIKPQYQSYELCLLAYKQNPKAIQYMSEEFVNMFK